MDSPKWISYLRDNLPIAEGLQWERLSKNEQLMWKMLYVSVWEKPAETVGFKNELEGIIRITSGKEGFRIFITVKKQEEN